MKTKQSAACFAELGHETRLEIFQYLVRGGHKGVPVGELQTKLNIPGSTLSHHISRLVTVGLVEQNREGRVLYCIPQYGLLNDLIAFLKKECCVNENLGESESEK